MNFHFLFKKTYDYETRIIKQVDKVSDNLTLFNIALDSDSLNLDSRPIHKRYEFGDFPPLDISFDSETGMLKEFTIFIRKAEVSNIESSISTDLVSLSGYPCFEFFNLEKHEYYYDEECQIEISIHKSALQINLLTEKIEKVVQINESLSLFLNVGDEFVGFLCSNLTEQDLIDLRN
ncbi:hypothetical protein IMX26_03670 [Clostridium sp. 'deep sea']|uniref:hypothetical protein n=1 Tax=Clostridium sp. 'deep sea' TaxID=2779445 RepID=UPI0018967F88|nr:hypothetical protein [Clostridium sp. 'deep sea']QOR35929.1 hypothetical protein IMX26_03670 [Clostridium sp. 'deep sea']